MFDVAQRHLLLAIVREYEREPLNSMLLDMQPRDFGPTQDDLQISIRHRVNYGILHALYICKYFKWDNVSK